MIIKKKNFEKIKIYGSSSTPTFVSNMLATNIVPYLYMYTYVIHKYEIYFHQEIHGFYVYISWVKFVKTVGKREMRWEMGKKDHEWMENTPHPGAMWSWI